jgi:diaminohydroxyphosphoribosylaminopyrimidine deaminase/5-amino-6-(5-phosphoribosylamino)uracil reductase
LIAAGVGRVVAAIGDPHPLVDGKGFDKLRSAGILVETGIGAEQAARSMAGFLTRQRLGRPFVTLKLAMSLDGRIALPSGESRWITGPEARAHAHLERARSEMILVGRVTLETDSPALDVRLEGLEQHKPRRAVLTSGDAPAGWEKVDSPAAIAALEGVDHLLVEGGAGTASAFLAADLVDRLLLYRAPILIGEGRPALGDIDLHRLADAHMKWRPHDSRMLGIDRLEVYERVRQDEPGSH